MESANHGFKKIATVHNNTTNDRETTAKKMKSFSEKTIFSLSLC
jgi:hypothetical protein